ncbi:MAG: hypothetical protein EOM14_06775 [Clostridia bacterium]|nr:hypothetical protein [Clostridia bacterium]
MSYKGLVYMTAPTIPYKHCFTTRWGGVSTECLESLNLGENRGDSEENVRENYRRLLEALELSTILTVTMSPTCRALTLVYRSVRSPASAHSDPCRSGAEAIAGIGALGAGTAPAAGSGATRVAPPAHPVAIVAPSSARKQPTRTFWR